MFESVEDVQSGSGRPVHRQPAHLHRRVPGRPHGPPHPDRGTRRASARPSWPRRSSDITGRQLIRLQCYEGLDEGKALYEWKYAKQLLYTQLLRERIGELIADAPSLPDAVAKIAGQEDAFFSFRFLSPRPLLSAILADDPVVLLIDEIDKAEPEFEAFLLEVLSDFQVSVPELGTIRAKHMPAGGPDLEQRARAVGRSQAALPAPVHRLPRAGRRAGDHPAQGAGDPRAPGPGRGGRRAEDPRHGAAQAAVGVGVARLGALAGHPQRPGARSRRWSSPPSPCWSSTRRTSSGCRARSTRSSPTSRPSSATMEERILEFIGDLRRAELRISPSEALDALAASAEVGLGSPRDVQVDAGRHAGQGEPATSRRSIGSSTCTSSISQALGEGLKKALGPEDPRMQEMLDQAAGPGGPAPRRADRADAARAGQRDGDGHPRRRAERRARAADVLPAGRTLLAGASPTASTGRRWSATSSASCRCWRRRASTPARWPASATTWSCAWRRSAA